MAILPFLLGLLPLVFAEELFDRLPEDPEPWRLVVTVPVLAIPALFARLRGVVAIRERMRNRATWRLARLLQLTSTAIAYGAWLFVGGGLDFIEAVDRHGPFVRGLVTVAPLLITELARLTAAREAARRIRKIGLDAPSDPPLLARRLTLAFGLVLIGLHAIFEIVEDYPSVLALLDSTMVGNTATLLIAVFLVLFFLPRLAVFVLPTRRTKNSTLRRHLEATLHGLGLKLNRVHLIDTKSRIYNAALVGVFPSSTRLLVTDGFVEVLRPEALRGVLAHEIGHDRAHHVAWLLIVAGFVPVLWIGPLFEWLLRAELVDLLGLGVIGLAALFLLYKLMHRFEHEADLLSAQLMGSGEGVLEALATVLKLHGGEDHSSFRHPSVARRTGVVLRWESDKAFRQRFARRGKRIRAGLLALAAVATVGSVFAHVERWPDDQLSYALTRGDFDRASALVERARDRATEEDERQAAQDLLTLCQAAATLSDEPFHDHASQLELARQARREAEASARSADLSSATTWLRVANSYGRSLASSEAALALLEAIEDEDQDRQRKVAEHLLALRSSPLVWTDLAREVIRDVSSD